MDSQTYVGNFQSYASILTKFSVYGKIKIIRDDQREQLDVTMSYDGLYRNKESINFTIPSTVIPLTAKLPGGQTLTLTLGLEQNNTIKGKYISENPYDNGEFTATKN